MSWRSGSEGQIFEKPRLYGMSIEKLREILRRSGPRLNVGAEEDYDELPF